YGVPPLPSRDEIDRLYEKWLTILARDPYYHPAFEKKEPGYIITEDIAAIQDPLPGRPLPVVLGIHANRTGCGHYRVIQPLNALRENLIIDGSLKLGTSQLVDAARSEPDIIVVQGAWHDESLPERITHYQKHLGARVLLEFDDFEPNAPVYNDFRRSAPKDLLRRIRRSIEKADWLVVSTEPLLEEYKKYHDDIRVAHNRLPVDWWA